jgi:hypothetical protein
VRLDRQDAVEVEGAAVEHLVERDGAALGAVDGGQRVDLADARLDGRQLLGVTRSVLLSRITSAKAIWSSASRLSFRRSGSAWRRPR